MRPERYRAAISTAAIVLTVGAGLIALGIFAYLAGGMAGEAALVRLGWITPKPASVIDEMFGEAMGRAMVALGVLAYAAVYVLPVFLLFPLIAPVIGLWRTPGRVLLLRPFNRGWPGRTLKRVVRHELSRFGHVYTLADADIRVPWMVRAMFLFGQFSLFSFRPRSIRTSKRVAQLRGMLERTGIRNLNWTLSYSKVFPLTTEDALWRECISELLPQMDAIVVDISQIKSNLVWELQLCGSLGLEDRLIYLASEEQQRTALAEAYQESFGVRIDAGKICTYNRRGLTETASLRRAMQAAQKRRDDRVELNGLAGHWLSMAAVLCFSLGFYPVLPLAFYPETHTDTWTYHLPYWNAWPGTWPHLPDVINAPALALFGCAILTFLMLVWAGHRDRPMRVLVPFQGAVVLLTAFGYFPSGFLFLLDEVDSLFR